MGVRRLTRAGLVAAAAVAFGSVAGTATTVEAADGPPLWAYGFTAPPPATPAPPAQAAAPPALDNTSPLTLPGSKLTFTRAQVANRFGPADWFPEDHPTMPDIVAHGKETAQPPVFALRPVPLSRRMGRAENANITGLSYDYIVQQLIDFKNGARDLGPKKPTPGLMAGFART